MTDREKLIALLTEAESLCAAIDCYDGAVCEYAGEINGCAAFRADHLISNGVVVREKGECKYCGGESNDFHSLNLDTVLYSGIEIAINKQGLLRVRYYEDVDRPFKSQEIIPIKFCPVCGADMRGAVNG